MATSPPYAEFALWAYATNHCTSIALAKRFAERLIGPIPARVRGSVTHNPGSRSCLRLLAFPPALTDELMKSSIIRRSVIIGGHKTSVSLEHAFWSDLKKIAHAQEATLSELVAKIDQTREQGNLSSAIRLYVLEHIRTHGRDNLGK
jgi:predicted DNA-binding ribbon-helix-helix protein